MVFAALLSFMAFTATRPEVTVKADSTSYHTVTKNVLLTGHVEVHREGDAEDSSVTLIADTISGRIDGIIEAYGNVRVRYGGLEAEASAGYYDMTTATGEFRGVRMVFDSWFIDAARINLEPTYRFYLSDLRFTACDEFPPHYDFRVGRAKFHRGRLSFFGSRMYLGKVPVLWVPYMSLVPGKPASPFHMKVGRSGYEGFYMKTGYRYDLGFLGDGTLKVDVRSRRGWAYGQEHRVPLESGDVTWDLYRMHERDRGARGLAKVNYDKDFTENLSALAQVYYVTDRNFIRDYRFSEFVSKSEPQSYGALTYRKPAAIAMLKVVGNNNRGDYEVAERAPELRAYFSPRPLPGRAYLTAGGGITAFRVVRPYDGDTALRASLGRRASLDLQYFTRANGEIRMDRPTRIPLRWTLTPYAFLNAAAYSEVNNRSERAVRTNPAVGATLSRFLSMRVLPRWDYSLRPVFDLSARGGAGPVPGTTPIIEEHIDYLHSGKPFRVILDQGIHQRKESAWEERIRVRLEGGYDADRRDRLRYLPIIGKVVASFGPSGRFDGELEYDYNVKEMRSVRAEANYERPRWKLSGGYFLRKEEPGVESHENLQSRGAARFGNWELGVGGSYDMERKSIEYATYELTRTFHDFIIGVGVTDNKFADRQDFRITGDMFLP